MPVARLLCEGTSGSPDVRLAMALTAPNGPRITPFGSKLQLGAGVTALVDVAKVETRLLRDRDFDSDPTGDGPAPEEVRWSDRIVGWRWRRHEIENYLLEPRLVALAFGNEPNFDKSAYEALLLQSARTIAAYEAMRWALGTLRRDLPRRMGDRPSGRQKLTKEELNAGDARQAGRDVLAKYSGDVSTQCSPAAFDALFDVFLARFQAKEFDLGAALVWFSGKDLGAGLELGALPLWWPGTAAVHSRVLAAIESDPEAATAIVPEWTGLRRLLTS